MIELDLHQDYGLTDTFRLRVLHTASCIGIKRAAMAHNVSLASIYRWRKAVITTTHKRGGK